MATDNFAKIIEAPITEAKIITAMDTVRSMVGVSGPIAITSFNQGRSLIVTCTGPAYT